MKNQLGIAIISMTILVSVFLMTHAFQNRHVSNNTIHVTGLGTKDFKSDLIVWSGSFTQRQYDLKQAYALLKQDQEKIIAYLTQNGISESEIVISSVEIDKEFNYSYDQYGNSKSEFRGYRLTQKVEIESKEIEKIEELARKITEIINLGVEFYSYSPQYYYTRLSELKIEMISSATEDARVRAEKIAANAGAQVGELKSARMGIFQIIGQNSNEDYSWGGSFNTSSKMKTATITMKLEFGIE